MTIEELGHRIKQLERALFVVCILVAAFIVYTFVEKRDDHSHTEQLLSARIDSMVAHDRYRDSTLAILHNERSELVSQVGSLRTQLDDVPNMINRVNNKYYDKRNHIIALTDDQQLELLSDNLSKDTDH